MNLLHNSDLIMASSEISGGVLQQTTTYSQIIDCEGFRNVLWITMGTSAWNPSTGTVWKCQGSTDSASTGAMVTYAGSVTCGQTTAEKIADYRLCLIDQVRLTHRYNRLKLVDDSTGSFVVLALRYGSRAPGTTSFHDSTTVWKSGLIVCAT